MDSHFLQLVGTAMSTKPATICQSFHGLLQRNHPQSLDLGNPLLKKVHRRHLPDLLRHYQPAAIPTGLHEPPPPHNQVHFSTLQPTNILPRHEDPH